MDRLPPFQYSLDAPPALLPIQDEINHIMPLELLQIHTSRTWDKDQLPTSKDGFILKPQYLEDKGVSHALRIALGQMRVSSHQLEIKTGRAKGIT